MGASFPPVGELWPLTKQSQGVADYTGACVYWQPSVRKRGRENLMPSGLGPSYAKCNYGSGCGCAQGAGGAAGSLLFALALALRIQRRAG